MVRLSQLSSTQKVALMVSLPTTAILLYFLVRSMMDDDDEEVERTRNVTSRQTVIEVKVPKKAVGAVIGSGGAQIKQIQETSGARVNFKDDGGDNQDRVALIRGSRESAQHAELMIHKIIAEQPEVVTEVIFVPRKAVGRIIGKGGDTIRDMTRASRARIIVDRSDEIGPNNTKKITLRGFPVAVASAKGLIQEKVNEEEVFQAKLAVASANRELRRKTKQTELSKEEDTPSTSGSQVSGQSNSWPAHSDFVEVYVSAVEHPGHFWVQLLSAKATQLDAMTIQMTECYSHPDFSQTCQAKNPKPGDMVAATYPGDKQWYRARVVGMENGKIDVYYVDFGDNALLEPEVVMELRSDFLSLPHQAVECRLAGVKPTGDTWSEEAIERFEDLVHVAKWRVIMARANSFSHEAGHGPDMPCLELIDTNTKQDINVALELLHGGLATPDSTETEEVESDQVNKPDIHTACSSNEDKTVTDSSKPNNEKDLCYTSHALFLPPGTETDLCKEDAIQPVIITDTTRCQAGLSETPPARPLCCIDTGQLKSTKNTERSSPGDSAYCGSPESLPCTAGPYESVCDHIAHLCSYDDDSDDESCELDIDSALFSSQRNEGHAANTNLCLSGEPSTRVVSNSEECLLVNEAVKLSSPVTEIIDDVEDRSSLIPKTPQAEEHGVVSQDESVDETALEPLSKSPAESCVDDVIKKQEETLKHTALKVQSETLPNPESYCEDATKHVKVCVGIALEDQDCVNQVSSPIKEQFGAKHEELTAWYRSDILSVKHHKQATDLLHQLENGSVTMTSSSMHVDDVSSLTNSHDGDVEVVKASHVENDDKRSNEDTPEDMDHKSEARPAVALPCLQDMADYHAVDIGSLSHFMKALEVLTKIECGDLDSVSGHNLHEQDETKEHEVDKLEYEEQETCGENITEESNTADAVVETHTSADGVCTDKTSVDAEMQALAVSTELEAGDLLIYLASDIALSTTHAKSFDVLHQIESGDIIVRQHSLEDLPASIDDDEIVPLESCQAESSSNVTTELCLPALNKNANTLEVNTEDNPVISQDVDGDIILDLHVDVHPGSSLDTPPQLTTALDPRNCDDLMQLLNHCNSLDTLRQLETGDIQLSLPSECPQSINNDEVPNEVVVEEKIAENLEGDIESQSCLPHVTDALSVKHKELALIPETTEAVCSLPCQSEGVVTNDSTANEEALRERHYTLTPSVNDLSVLLASDIFLLNTHGKSHEVLNKMETGDIIAAEHYDKAKLDVLHASSIDSLCIQEVSDVQPNPDDVEECINGSPQHRSSLPDAIVCQVEDTHNEHSGDPDASEFAGFYADDIMKILYFSKAAEAVRTMEEGYNIPMYKCLFVPHEKDDEICIEADAASDKATILTSVKSSSIDEPVIDEVVSQEPIEVFDAQMPCSQVNILQQVDLVDNDSGEVGAYTSKLCLDETDICDETRDVCEDVVICVEADSCDKTDNCDKPDICVECTDNMNEDVRNVGEAISGVPVKLYDDATICLKCEHGQSLSNASIEDDDEDSSSIQQTGVLVQSQSEVCSSNSVNTVDDESQVNIDAPQQFVTEQCIKQTSCVEERTFTDVTERSVAEASTSEEDIRDITPVERSVVERSLGQESVSDTEPVAESLAETQMVGETVSSIEPVAESVAECGPDGQDESTGDTDPVPESVAETVEACESNSLSSTVTHTDPVTEEVAETAEHHSVESVTETSPVAESVAETFVKFEEDDTGVLTGRDSDDDLIVEPVPLTNLVEMPTTEAAPCVVLSQEYSHAVLTDSPAEHSECHNIPLVNEHSLRSEASIPDQTPSLQDHKEAPKKKKKRNKKKKKKLTDKESTDNALAVADSLTESVCGTQYEECSAHLTISLDPSQPERNELSHDYDVSETLNMAVVESHVNQTAAVNTVIIRRLVAENIRGSGKRNSDQQEVNGTCIRLKRKGGKNKKRKHNRRVHRLYRMESVIVNQDAVDDLDNKLVNQLSVIGTPSSSSLNTTSDCLNITDSDSSKDKSSSSLRGGDHSSISPSPSKDSNCDQVSEECANKKKKRKRNRKKHASLVGDPSYKMSETSEVYPTNTKLNFESNVLSHNSKLPASKEEAYSVCDSAGDLLVSKNSFPQSGTVKKSSMDCASGAPEFIEVKNGRCSNEREEHIVLTEDRLSNDDVKKYEIPDLAGLSQQAEDVSSSKKRKRNRRKKKARRNSTDNCDESATVTLKQSTDIHEEGDKQVKANDKISDESGHSECSSSAAASDKKIMDTFELVNLPSESPEGCQQAQAVLDDYKENEICIALSDSMIDNLGNLEHEVDISEPSVKLSKSQRRRKNRTRKKTSALPPSSSTAEDCLIGPEAQDALVKKKKKKKRNRKKKHNESNETSIECLSESSIPCDSHFVMADSVEHQLVASSIMSKASQLSDSNKDTNLSRQRSEVVKVMPTELNKFLVKSGPVIKETQQQEDTAKEQEKRVDVKSTGESNCRNVETVVQEEDPAVSDGCQEVQGHGRIANGSKSLRKDDLSLSKNALMTSYLEDQVAEVELLSSSTPHKTKTDTISDLQKASNDGPDIIFVAEKPALKVTVRAPRPSSCRPPEPHGTNEIKAGRLKKIMNNGSSSRCKEKTKSKRETVNLLANSAIYEPGQPREAFRSDSSDDLTDEEVDRLLHDKSFVAGAEGLWNMTNPAEANVLKHQLTDVQQDVQYRACPSDDGSVTPTQEFPGNKVTNNDCVIAHHPVDDISSHYNDRCMSSESPDLPPPPALTSDLIIDPSDQFLIAHHAPTAPMEQGSADDEREESPESDQQVLPRPNNLFTKRWLQTKDKQPRDSKNFYQPLPVAGQAKAKDSKMNDSLDNDDDEIDKVVLSDCFNLDSVPISMSDDSLENQIRVARASKRQCNSIDSLDTTGEEITSSFTDDSIEGTSPQAGRFDARDINFNMPTAQTRSTGPNGQISMDYDVVDDHKSFQPVSVLKKKKSGSKNKTVKFHQPDKAESDSDLSTTSNSSGESYLVCEPEEI